MSRQHARHWLTFEEQERAAYQFGSPDAAAMYANAAEQVEACEELEKQLEDAEEKIRSLEDRLENIKTMIETNKYDSEMSAQILLGSILAEIIGA